MTAILLRSARLSPGAEPVDLRIDGDRIARIAPNLAAPRSEDVDLEGRIVVPGLWDSHVHLEQWALVRRRVDVASARSAAETVERMRVAASARSAGEGGVLVGFGFRDGLWPDAPTRGLLDAVPVPAAIISGDVHAVWTNSAALRMLGLDPDDWFVREQPAFDLNSRLVELSGSGGDADSDERVAEAVRAAARRGVVGIVDLETRDSGAAWVRRRADPGFPRIRVRAGVYPADLERARGRGQRTGEPLRDTGGLVAGGPLKLFTDGALNSRTAYLDEPYADVGGRGVAVYTPADLEAAIRQGLEAGLVPAVHAIGDAAVALALDAMEHTSSGGSIEHAQLIRRADLPRFAALGVTASIQPEHAVDDRDVADRYWPGRGDRVIPARALLDAGASVVLGSDAPVAPLDPWITAAAAVFRTRGRDPWHPEQTITVDEALAASVRTRIAVGEPADLAVLDGDPWAADDATLRVMPVAATMLAGEWIHRTI